MSPTLTRARCTTADRCRLDRSVSGARRDRGDGEQPQADDGGDERNRGNEDDADDCDRGGDDEDGAASGSSCNTAIASRYSPLVTTGHSAFRSNAARKRPVRA
ncbi:hypothetical protein D8S78_16425 [Natrialba swarupiae]|nr:hypothetical protein [Natrialba swarupiae]